MEKDILIRRLDGTMVSRGALMMVIRLLVNYINDIEITHAVKKFLIW